MKAPSSWSTPGAIRAQLQRLWDDGRMLSARLHGETLFNALRDDVFGERIRMEQERLGYGWVRDTIDRL